MVRIFGWPPKSYRGPYPTEAEALKLTDQALKTASADFFDGVVRISGGTVQLGKVVAEELAADLGISKSAGDFHSAGPSVKATAYQDQCLIVRVTAGDYSAASPRDLAGSEGAYLFDLSTKRPFARYIFAGNASRIARLLLR